MLYLSNNGETCKDQLCQHPECWQTNVRRVRQAVRQRNGIKEEQNVNTHNAERFGDRERRETESYSLPTLKIIDVTEDLVTPYNSSEQVLGEDDQEKHLYSPMLCRSACRSALKAEVPHTTPASPSLPEKHANRWKEKLDSFNEHTENEKMTTINFHEIYEYDEVCQDWQDTFISTAYLVWCPSKKKRRKKARSRRTSSAVSQRRKGFKNPVEDMLPLPPERSQKQRSTSSKVPTGGQPYSPCRSPLSRMYNFRPEDYNSDGEYIMTLTKEDVPKSLVASKKILERKPHTTRKDEQLMELKKSSSTKVLVDISATLETPGEIDESRKVESREEVTEHPKALPECARVEKRKAKFLKQPSDFASRQMLPLPSIAIPWGIIPDNGRRGHCKNSIPHCVDLDVMMEPVLYLPRTVNGSRSKVCADLGEKQEAMKERPSTGPAHRNSGTFDERHLTSAYRLSPKNIGTPAPTPATPGTRDSRRHRSGLRRTNTKDSPSRTRLWDVSETEHGALDGSYSQKITAVRRKSSKARNDEAILEIAESNRETSESIGNELSKFSLSQNNTDTNDDQKSIEPQSLGLDKVPDSESVLSDRAVSPSSRTNIPSDIWAELRNGGGFDHRRIIPRSNSDLRSNSDHPRPRSLFRGYHSSLGLSIYSYSGESNWKPHPPKLPKSFTYMGVYKPTILPKMPAALTVVPAPSSTRTYHVTEPREVKVHLSKIRSIRIPAVPTVSPVPNADFATPSSTSIVAGTSSLELFTVTMKKSEESQSLESLTRAEESTEERTPVPEEDFQDNEYLISRETVQDTGMKSPLNSEDRNAGTDVLWEGQDTARAKETLQDFVNNDKSATEDTQRFLESISGQADEFVQPLPSVTCAKSEVTCAKPESARETVKPSMDEKDSKDEILSSSNEISCTEEAITCVEDDITSTKEKITCLEEETTCKENETSGSKENFTGSTEKTTCIKEEIVSSESKVRCQIDDATCTNNQVTCDSREESIRSYNKTPVSIEISESETEPTSNVQNNDAIEETTLSNNDGRLTPDKEISRSRSPDIPSAQRSLHQSRSTMQGSFRSLMFPEDMRSILSDTSLIPKVPSDFELTPLNVKSELLQPIEIDSDLLVLSDSFMDLSLEDDLDTKNEISDTDFDKTTE